MKKLKVIVSGGGTGGHIFPAIAIANALKLSHKKAQEVKLVISGAGAAGISIVKLLLTFGIENIIMCDTQGSIFKGRKHNMNP